MRKLSSLALILMISANAFAQREAGAFNIQPKVGLNVANLTNADGADARVGLVIGAEGEYNISPKFSVTAGLLYSQQGAKDSEYDGFYKIDEIVKFDYINIPILANIYVARGFAFKLGIQPGFNINSKAKFKTSGASAESDIEDTKTLDFSIPVGLSYEYANLQLDVRYNWGLTEVNSNLDKCKNSVFQFTLGYKFNLSK
ncbi:MAG: PorT family protein [Bacteroides sp.]|nr:PorT family protein [Roseburia sp.]MCM1346600.1 PorT family protein [Bacteroides sp.]MCM1420500.1 PorT family protein [Bacteroides sp.]